MTPDVYLRPIRRRFFIVPIVGLLLVFVLFSACDQFTYEATQPPYYETFEVSGTPYERGFQHGQRFESKIRSLYTMLLTTSIFPYLNRERADVASVMLRYQDEEIYGDGKFSFQMMLESGWDLIEFFPEDYVDEMRGIADGAQVPFDEILVMNTFFDTLMGFRSITFFIKLLQSPSLLAVEVLGAQGDGLDNDGDGDADEPYEALHEPYDPSPYATFVEVPTDAKFRFIIDDDKQGVDMGSVRIQLGDTVYAADHPSVLVEPYAREGKTVRVTFTPPDGLPPAGAVALNLQCTDLQEYVRTPPHHPRSMRDERITVTTIGYGRPPWQVPNRGVDDGRTQPPAVAFAVRGEATTDGSMILGHNFAMLDSNIAHKHPLLLLHRPDDGPAFITIGYPGIMWGFSGMNENGVTFAYNASDTLNNSFTASFNEGLIFGRLEPAGVPAGIMGREILSRTKNVAEALNYLGNTPATFGWNFLVGDAAGEFAMVELDGNIMGRPEGAAFSYDADSDNPENWDPYGQMLASVGPDDLRMASHYQKDTEDIRYQIVNFDIKPQRYWSSFYLRSLRVFFNMGIAIENNYGQIDAQRAQEILAHKNLEDQRDSMNSAVYDPAKLRAYIAAGEVPSTDAGFELFDLGAALAGEQQ